MSNSIRPSLTIIGPFWNFWATLFRNINTTCSSKGLLDIAVNSELTSCQGSGKTVSIWTEEADARNLPNHEQTSTDTSIATAEAKLLGDLDQTTGSSLSR